MRLIFCIDGNVRQHTVVKDMKLILKLICNGIAVGRNYNSLYDNGKHPVR